MHLRAVEARLLAVAPWVFGVSLAGHLLMVAFQTKMTMIDLMVYRNGSPELFTGNLYDWRLSEFSDKFALPFTYPPFSALLFLPLSWIPWGAARWFWQLLSLACLWLITKQSLRLIGAHDSRRVLLWTGLLVWVEPVRTTLNYGQINLALCALLLVTLVSLKDSVAGAGVGIAAGIKLTPAISGLYFLVTKRFRAAALSAAAFVGTVAIGYAVSPGQSHRFWFELLGDADRVGPVGSAINQSLRGALSRTVGHDVGSGPVYLAGVAVAVALTAWALHAARRDTLAMIVAVQFLGLLVSPISWSHHWVWVVPALMWLLYRANHPIARITAGLWVLAIGGYLISILLILQPSIWIIERPWYLSALGWAYPALGLLTLVAIVVSLRVRREDPVDLLSQ
ncbi:mannosyltransferase [Saccharothrix violaceirubra]|uniref:Alpha-1,2-mannosyltransferase n=1 Tax=Saccharothrix violaceirubra TaxID=413306 RepID=A0A7W7T8E1_9PSEU|nr:mannosyltransferase [Saccharothrix violaceirubra]MBB4968451.1 alpha-1,2-mannosyltransferase [Saccharothrix violaceirubra]